MKPTEIPLDADAITRAVRAHGLDGKAVSRAPSTGIINVIYMVDDRYVLRVPRNHPGHFTQARREAAVLPALVDHGVTTAPLVVFDDSNTLLPAPFLIVERARGVDAESAGVRPPDPAATWRRLGRELALTHATPVPVSVDGDRNMDELIDVHDLIDARASDGSISTVEADTLHDWTGLLASDTRCTEDLVLVHGDAQMSNVLVTPGAGDLVSLIDWGCAHVGTRAIDFRVVPLAAVGPMLDGYRDIAGATVPTLEAEVLLARLQLLLHVLPRGAAPGLTWGERPLAWLTDLALHMADDPRWTDLLPRSRSMPDRSIPANDPTPKKATGRVTSVRPDHRLVPLVVVSGPIASGKSTIAEALGRRLLEHGKRCAVTDLDDVADCLIDDPENWEATWSTARRVHNDVVAAFRRTDLDYVIAHGSFFYDNEPHPSSDGLGDSEAVRVLLQVSLERALERVAADPDRTITKNPDFLAWTHEQFNQRVPTLPTQHLNFDTEAFPADAIVDHIITSLGASVSQEEGSQ